MKEEYIFPKNNWYLKFEESDRELVDNWRINIVKYSDKPCPGNIINWRAAEEAGRGIWLGFEITIEQFKQYVLNIKDESSLPQEPEDLSYLIGFLNKLNIK